MKERLFGMETEYGLTVVPSNGADIPVENVAGDLVNLARRRAHLPGLHSGGIFLANGARFYVDCGAHPEFATPECANPWDICRYVQAGEQMLMGLAGQLPSLSKGIERTLILRNNTDYTSRATWGCHESYLHGQMTVATLSRQIIPHLVSRVLYTGAGGFDCHSPGIAFLVSPRVSHLESVISGNSTGARGIFHTRDEPLCGNGYRRLHILCGESLCGETGTWLKIGTTALVVALIEAGKHPGDGIHLSDPLAAMRAFAADPECKHPVKLANGREATALDIQDYYLRQAEAHADAAFMPPWAGEVCRRWRAVLERLRAGGPAAVATTLDWAIKFALLQSHLRRRGATFEEIAAWTRVMERLGAADTARGERTFTAAIVLASRSPMAAARRRLTPFLHELGLAWDGLAAFLALRLELFEIDTRYSILGDGGLFTSLDLGGVLDHRLTGVDNIAHALDYPPAIGRAALRGAAIRRVAGHIGRFACEWDCVFDLKTDKRLNLADPFCSTEEWEKIEIEIRKQPATPDLETLFRAGRYAEVLSRIPAPIFPLAGNIECISLSFARLGRLPEALAILDGERERLGPFHHICLSMSALSNGFVPDTIRLAPLIEEGGPLLEQQGSSDSYSRYIFRLYKALFLMNWGFVPLADALFTALMDEPANAFRTRMYSRTRCYFAELNRRLGRVEFARQLARDASMAHRAERLNGDLADHSLVMLAKLSTDDSEAAECLSEAEATQRLLCNNLGLARTLCIRARRLRFADDRREVELLQRTVPVLRECAVARRIVCEWRDWIAPETGPEPLDYWGL